MIDFEDSIGLSIENIVKRNPKISPNGNVIICIFVIITDKGEISFTSNHFEQTVLKQPILSESINIRR